jgi:glutathione peroxidase-family protein
VRVRLGDDFPLDKLKGKVTLITNVACACGLTNSK